MARRKTGDKKLTGRKVDIPKVQADDHSIAFEELHIGGDVGGDIRIGHTIGYTADQVSVLLKQITTTLQPRKFDGRCPYKGLEVFEEEDAELFFGRERLVNELVGRVKESRTVFITGPSGSGKSSLVRAGLIHALKQGKIKSSDRWLYETMKPGREPLKDLALAFSRLKSPELEDYFLTHSTETNILNKCAESVLSSRKDQRFLLFIDQFEEVFTQISGEDERVAFINMLAHAGTIENGRVIVLFAMRSDFVSNCATYPLLNEMLSQEFRQIGAMQPEELVSAIALPAQHVGLPIEDELIARIINDMKGEPGALPLMQFALKDLFDSQQEKGGVIALTLKDYLGHGGIHKSLERHADATFARLNRDQQELTRSIFSGLIEIGRGTQDTKRTAMFDELIPTNTKAGDVLVIVQKLADARLIITDEQAGKDTVTISHEKLIEAWPWLKKLVNENRDVIALQNEISADAREWEDHQRDNSYLYSGARLATAQEKNKNLVLNENAQAYLKAGLKVEENVRLQSKRTQRRIIAGLLIFSTIVLGLLIFSLIQLNISRAQNLGSQAQAAFAEQNYNNALLYAYQSNLIHKNNAANLILSQIAYKNFALGKLFTGHIASVTSVAWSANGQLASGSWDNAVILWDLKTGRPAQTFKGHTGLVTSVAWSVDGQLASGSSDGTVIIWDLKTSQPAQTLKGHTGYVNSVAWSADGQLASGSSDNTVIIWDLKTGQPAQTLQGHAGSVTSVAWSADGQLASGSSDNTVILWNLETGQLAQTLKGFIVAWSVDGQLASGSSDNSVILWNLETGQPTQTLEGHTGYVNSVAWSVDGQLASGSSDNMVIIWDLKTSQPAQTLKEHLNYVSSVAWSADGQLASSSDDKTVIVWDLKTGQPAQTLTGHTNSVSSVAWSANGQLASGSWDNAVILWDLKTGQPAQTFKGQTSDRIVSSVAWSVDGPLASGSSDGTVIIWDLKTGQPAQTLKGHTGLVSSVAWSADGQLASGSDDKTVIVWDLETNQPAQILKGHTSPVSSVAWSADGQLASGSYDNTVIIWDLETNQPAQTFKGHTNYVSSVAWSADGQLASGSYDNTVILWDLKTGRPAQTFKGHAGLVTSVTWSANGQLTSGSYDSVVIIWDSKTGKPAQTFKGHTGYVNSVAWSVDGQLASGSGDNTIKISRADLTSPNPCEKMIRNMTIDEWLNYQGPLYIYQPTCSNLYNPTEALNPTRLILLIIENSKFVFNLTNSVVLLQAQDFEKALITWKGRAILFTFLLVIIGVFIFFVWLFYKSARWAWHKLSDRRGKQT